MFANNNKGITLIEVLATLSISFMIVGVVSSVLFQSHRNMEISEQHTNLRQEANLIISSFVSTQLNPTCNGTLCYYTIHFERNSTDEWILKVGNYHFQSSDFDIFLEIVILNTETPNLTTIDSIASGGSVTRTFNPRDKLHIKSLRLTNKSKPSQFYELSTIIHRL